MNVNSKTARYGNQGKGLGYIVRPGLKKQNRTEQSSLRRLPEDEVSIQTVCFVLVLKVSSLKPVLLSLPGGVRG